MNFATWRCRSIPFGPGVVRKCGLRIPDHHETVRYRDPVLDKCNGRYELRRIRFSLFHHPSMQVLEISSQATETLLPDSDAARWPRIYPTVCVDEPVESLFQAWPVALFLLDSTGMRWSRIAGSTDPTDASRFGSEILVRIDIEVVPRMHQPTMQSYWSSRNAAGKPVQTSNGQMLAEGAGVTPPDWAPDSS